MRMIIHGLIFASLLALTGCATPIVTYQAEGAKVTYNQGVGTLTVTTPDSVLAMAPTFRYQNPRDVPTFTLSVSNTSSHDIDFDPATLVAFTGDKQCGVYSLEERVLEIRRSAKRKQVALAILGGLAAGAAAYGASHYSESTTVYGVAGHRPFVATATTNVYDPAAGILAGGALVATTGIGLRQIQVAAGHEEQAAQAILQRTTIPAGATVIGQVILKPATADFVRVRIDVPAPDGAKEFAFIQHRDH